MCNNSTCACFFISLLKVFAEWEDISFTIQDAIFEEDENEQIDIHYGFLVSKETVVLRRWGRSKLKFGFIKRVDKTKF